MKKIVIILGIIFSFNSFATIEEEVEKERFKREGDVLIDTWSGLNWEDKNKNKIKESYKKAKQFCRGEWRLPTIAELELLYKYKHKLNYLVSHRTSWVYPAY
jgi:hypothetical protein